MHREQYHWLANLACDESGRWFDALLAPPLLDIDELDLQSICLFHRVVQLLRTERGTELAELVGLARDPLPELASRAAFLIMAAMHWCANTMLGGQQQLVEDALCGLQACREGRVDGRWLAGSHIFCVDTFSDGHHTVDILLDTAARLREAPDTPTTREITGWLDQLLQRREMRRNR